MIRLFLFKFIHRRVFVCLFIYHKREQRTGHDKSNLNIFRPINGLIIFFENHNYRRDVIIV